MCNFTGWSRIKGRKEGERRRDLGVGWYDHFIGLLACILLMSLPPTFPLPLSSSYSYEEWERWIELCTDRVFLFLLQQKIRRDRERREERRMGGKQQVAKGAKIARQRDRYVCRLLTLWI